MLLAVTELLSSAKLTKDFVKSPPEIKTLALNPLSLRTSLPLLQHLQNKMKIISRSLRILQLYYRTTINRTRFEIYYLPLRPPRPPPMPWFSPQVTCHSNIPAQASAPFIVFGCYYHSHAGRTSADPESLLPPKRTSPNWARFGPLFLPLLPMTFVTSYLAEPNPSSVTSNSESIMANELLSSFLLNRLLCAISFAPTQNLPAPQPMAEHSTYALGLLSFSKLSIIYVRHHLRP
jgi:hypothetical protein